MLFPVHQHFADYLRPFLLLWGNIYPCQVSLSESKRFAVARVPAWCHLIVPFVPKSIFFFLLLLSYKIKQLYFNIVLVFLIPLPSNGVTLSSFFILASGSLTLLLSSLQITTWTTYFRNIPPPTPTPCEFHLPFCLIFLAKVQDLSRHIENIHPSVVRDERGMKYAKR